jgi:hypothetical protein
MGFTGLGVAAIGFGVTALVDGGGWGRLRGWVVILTSAPTVPHDEDRAD